MTRPTQFRTPYVEPVPTHRVRAVLLSDDWVSWALARLEESDRMDCSPIPEGELMEGYGITHSTETGKPQERSALPR